MASALEMYRLASGAPLSTTSSDTGSLGVSTKWKVLSAGSGSVPARTIPRTFGPDSVNGANVTDDDAWGATVARSVSSSWPSTVSDTGTFPTASSPLLLSPAVTAIRSWPEKADRPNVTDGTARLRALAEPIGIVVSVIPSGKRASSDPVQPVF